MSVRRCSGFGALEMILSAVLLISLYYLAMHGYRQRPAVAPDIAAQATLNTTTYQSLVDSTRKEVGEFNARQKVHEKSAEGLLE